MAPEGPESLLAACDPAVVETILNARAPSMNALYSNRWKLFASWCDCALSEPRSYVDRTAVFQQSDALCATQELLKAVLSKQRFSNWIVEAIVQGYSAHTSWYQVSVH